MDGFPDWPTDDEGYPLPGLVVRHYRLQRKYLAEDGKERAWTQKQLGCVLGLSEKAIRLMENQSLLLDSLSRRKVLCDLLAIPPALLGLSNLSALNRILQGEPEAPAILQAPRASSETLSLYQGAFRVYHQTYEDANLPGKLAELEAWIKRIENDVSTSGNLAGELRTVLWLFYMLASRVYSEGLSLPTKAMASINRMMSLANGLNSSDLKAATMYALANVYFESGQPAMARSSMEMAVEYAKGASAGVKSGVYAYGALALAWSQPDLADITYTEQLLDLSGRFAESKMDVDVLRFNYGRFLIDTADTLVTLGRYGKAEEWLDEAEDYFGERNPRRTAYINILRAESEIKRVRPDYEHATTLLLGTLALARELQSSYLEGYVRRLYLLLKTSSFASHPRFADLTTMLRTRSL